jgi:hypothetical protein
LRKGETFLKVNNPPTEVNYFEPSSKVDFTCRVHLRRVPYRGTRLVRMARKSSLQAAGGMHLVWRGGAIFMEGPLLGENYRSFTAQHVRAELRLCARGECVRLSTT